MKIEYPWWWKKIGDTRGIWIRNANDSVNVRIESIPYANGSIDELTNGQTNLTRQQFPGQVLLESNKSSIGDNYIAHKIVFRFPEVPGDLNNKFKEMQIWTINGRRAYIISYFTTLDAYDSYIPIVKKIINSFRTTPICS